jgi:hypothetical protein
MFTKFFEHKSFLHTILRLNAAFSGLFGLIFLIFPSAVGSWLSIPSTFAITVTGVSLLGWELFIAFIVSSNPISPTAAWIVIGGDVVWVLGSVALLLGGWLPLTLAGKWFIAIIADIVLLFAISQFMGLRRQS